MNKDEKIINKMLMSTEKNYNLKVENYAFFSRQTEDISPGGSLSQISLKVTISKN